MSPHATPSVAQSCPQSFSRNAEKDLLVLLVTAGFEMALKSGVAFISGCVVAVLLAFPDWLSRKYGAFALMGCDDVVMSSEDKRPELMSSE